METSKKIDLIFFIAVIIALLCALLLAPNGREAWGEEPSPEAYAYGEFVAETKDFEEESIGAVKVLQSKVQDVPWTLDEIDYRMSIYELNLAITLETAKEYRIEIDKLKALRPKVEAEAIKVKIKNVSDKNL